jgi:hypothetical protein
MHATIQDTPIGTTPVDAIALVWLVRELVEVGVNDYNPRHSISSHGLHEHSVTGV